jgi:NAD(P)-dependent dehydrogenase (short-subunit alcohol dehydrogenase family)
MHLSKRERGMSGELAGKVVIITGGASGIGRASVELFASEGAKVVIADIQVERGEMLAGSLGGNAVFHRTDVTREVEVEALVHFAIERFGSLDVMFNNAGGGAIADVPFLERDFSEFEQVISLNLLGPMLGMKHAGRHMLERGGGSIINTCSTGGIFPGIGIPFYRAAKAGLLQVSKSLALELSPQGIRVNCITPGPVTTDTFGTKFGLSQDKGQRIEKVISEGLLGMQALKRPIRPLDIAQGALYLASERSSRVTGHNLVISAGSGLGDPVNHAQELSAAIAAAMT